VEAPIGDAGHRVVANLDLASQHGGPEAQRRASIDDVEAEVLEGGERHSSTVATPADGTVRGSS
jgi:hypothetical protein